MVLMAEMSGKVIPYWERCHAGSPEGNFCELKKNHEGLHEKKAGRRETGELWAGSYSQSGVELIKALNKDGLFDIPVTPELSMVYGNIFDEVVEQMEYSCCADCKGREYRD